MFEVRTPAPGVTEIIGGVSFVDGVATVGHGPALAYFRSAGYVVVDLDEAAPYPVEESADPPSGGDLAAGQAPVPPDPERPKGNASAEAWRAYAVTRGMTPEEAAGLNRDDLVARFPEETK
jgi:hypothetical protein